MWPDQISNRKPMALESDTLPTVLCGLLACLKEHNVSMNSRKTCQTQDKLYFYYSVLAS